MNFNLISNIAKAFKNLNINVIYLIRSSEELIIFGHSYSSGRISGFIRIPQSAISRYLEALERN